MMLRSLVVLLLIFNLLVLSWTAGIFSRWGWGPTTPHPETQAQAPVAPQALKVINVEATMGAAPAAATTPFPSSTP